MKNLKINKKNILLLLFIVLVSLFISNYHIFLVVFETANNHEMQIDIHSKINRTVDSDFSSPPPISSGENKDFFESIYRINNSWTQFNLNLKWVEQKNFSVCFLSPVVKHKGDEIPALVDFKDITFNGEKKTLNHSTVWAKGYACLALNNTNKTMNLVFSSKIHSFTMMEIIQMIHIDLTLFFMLFLFCTLISIFIERMGIKKSFQSLWTSVFLSLESILISTFILFSFMSKNYAEYSISTYLKTAVLIILCWLLSFVIMIIKKMHPLVKEIVYIASFLIINTCILKVTYCSHSFLLAMIIALFLLFLLDFIYKFNFSHLFLRFLILLNLISLSFYVYERFDFKSIQAWENFELQKKPNIYLVVLESYTGSEGFKKIFNYDNSKFETELKNLGFKIYSDFYTATPSTKGSFYSLFTLKKANSQKEINTIHDILEGKIHSPVLDILRYNNYEVYYAFGDEYLIHNHKSTLFSSNYNYMTRERKHVPEELIPDILSFLENCKNTPYLFVTKIGALYNAGALTAGGVCHPVGVYEESNDIHKLEAYKKIYVKEVKKQNPYVIYLLKQILKKDPNAIVVLLGDHGSAIKTIFTEKNSKKIFSENEICLSDMNITAAIYFPKIFKGYILPEMHYNSSVFYHILKLLGPHVNIEESHVPFHCAENYLKKEKTHAQ